jgi:outer membrane protein assembly factor BamB
MKLAPLGTLLLFAIAAVALADDWRQFRGTDNNSVSRETNLPTTFSDQANVAWKAPLPGSGPSSPIVVGGRVLVTCATGPRQDRLHLLCFDAASGKRLWERQLWATGPTVINPFGGVAANTPASDGQRVFALYSSNDLACFDLEGNLLWLRGLALECPSTRNDCGMASSPLVVGGIVVVQLESQGESFVAGLDAANGETRWRLDRAHEPLWSSPIVLRGKTPEEDVVLLQSRGIFAAHDPRTGKQAAAYDHWSDTIASATTWNQRVYLPASGLHALEFDRGAGSFKLLWQEQRLRGGSPCPVVKDDRVYVVKDAGILVCGDAANGKVLWQLRLKGPIWSTPVLAGNHLYVVNHNGLVQVVRLGEKGEMAGTGQIESGALASPAVADGAIYFRTNAQLWKIAATR